MDEKKLQKLESLLKIVDESLTKEEFILAFEIVVKLVRDLQVTNKEEFELMRTALDSFSAKLKEANITDIQTLRDQVQDSLITLSDKVDAKLATIRNGEDGEDGEPGEQGLPGKDGSPDTGEEIIAKINKADSLISKEAVEGMKELQKAVEEKTGNTVRVGWGSHPLTIQGLGAVIDKNTRVLNFAGAGLTSVVRSANGVVTVNLAGAGGTVYAETPTGLINGSNVTYTTAHDITNVYNFAINGQFLHPAEYSFTGDTITLVTALPASLSGLPFTITYS